jgi:hypothetical protein
VNADFESESFALIDVNSITEGGADWLLEKHLGERDPATTAMPPRL